MQVKYEKLLMSSHYYEFDATEIIMYSWSEVKY